MPKQLIYMDLDGVLADFVTAYKEMFNRDAYEDDSFTVQQFVMQEPHFFRKLKIIPKGLELLNYLRNKYRIVFLTAPMDGMEWCKFDKILWVEENIGKDFDIIFDKDKAKYVVDEQSILIDDMQHNLDAWAAAGGTAIKFPAKIDKILAKIETVMNPEAEIKKVKFQLKNMDVELEPSELQKLNGNYKKGKIDYKGLKIQIENPKGSIRFGIDERGRKWVQRMKHHYGYITGTEGNDFDPIDVFLGNKVGASRAFIVNQGRDGLFDEHKVILCADNIDEARQIYLSNYQKNWDGLMSIYQLNTKKLRDWLNNGNLNEPYKPKKRENKDEII